MLGTVFPTQPSKHFPFPPDLLACLSSYLTTDSFTHARFTLLLTHNCCSYSLVRSRAYDIALSLHIQAIFGVGPRLKKHIQVIEMWTKT